ncbi:MAG: hypothetical protein WKF34_09675 [Pyrinomonadaceae bacterium]
MREIDHINVRRNWEECRKELGAEARWGVLYASLNMDGQIRLSRITHEALGSPDSYVLLYDRERETIGLRPARLAVEKTAYKANARGAFGGRRINAYRLCRDFGVKTSETVRFHHCAIDNSGVLILDLRDTCPARKSRKRQNHSTGGQRDEYGNTVFTY